MAVSSCCASRGWIARHVIALVLVGGFAVNQENTLSMAASAIQAMDVAIIGAPLTPETNGGQLDYGRAVMMDGANLVTTTSSTRKVMVSDAPLYTEYATIAVYDAGFTPIAVQNFGNAVDAVDGSTTILLNGVVDAATGAYYVAGKSDVTGTDLCSLDSLAAPARKMFQPYILKYHLDVASNALVLDGCIRINFANSKGVPKTGEISGMAIGDGRIFVGGSTTGTHVAVDDVPNLVAIRDGTGRNDEEMTVGALYNADAYVASFDLNLADMQILKYGTADWEEVLDLEYDDVDGMIYTVGSTHGDMCKAYEHGDLYPSVQRISTQVCTAGFRNTSAAGNRSNVRFDAYVAAFQWVPGAAHPLKHKAVKQFGADGEDTFNGLAFHRDLSGTARLYVAGKYTPPGRNDMDAKVVRMGVWAAGTTPDAILLNASVETYVRGVPGSTEAAGEIALTDTAAYVVGVRNGALGTHAGPCGDGPDSQLIPRIDWFDHTSPLSPGLAYEYVSTIRMHRTGDVRGIAIDTSGNRVIAYGASNYAQGPDEVSFCGDPTSPDYIDNANLGGADENMDQLAATFFHGAL